jgi:hypothetical protein
MGHIRSRRKALRIPGKNLRVFYKTAFEEGEGLLRDISTIGCALTEPTIILQPGEKLLLSIRLPEENNTIEAQGRVVRVEEADLIAVHFTLIEAEDQYLIRHHFAKLRREKTGDNDIKIK